MDESVSNTEFLWDRVAAAVFIVLKELLGIKTGLPQQINTDSMWIKTM